jgi:hypothetical protein
MDKVSPLVSSQAGALSAPPLRQQSMRDGDFMSNLRAMGKDESGKDESRKFSLSAFIIHLLSVAGSFQPPRKDRHDAVGWVERVSMDRSKTRILVLLLCAAVSAD